MEFVAGAIVAFVLTVAVFYAINRIQQNSPHILKLRASQSRTISMYPPLLNIGLPKPLDTQAAHHRNKVSTRILFTETEAYWIKDNQVYVAKLDNGLIVENSEQRVDMMALSKVELDEMMFIVEKLTEGKNIDNSGSGN